MSRRPGIGHTWFSKYSSDVFPQDIVVVKGKVQKVPRYYDKLIERFDPELWNDVRMERESKIVFDIDKGDVPSLDARRLNVEARLNRYQRSVD